MGKNMFLLKCLKTNTVVSRWAELNKFNRFSFVSVRSPLMRSTESEYREWKKRTLNDTFWENSIKTRKKKRLSNGQTVTTFINRNGKEEIIPDVPHSVRQNKKWGKTA